MQRRRLGLMLAILVCAVLIAARPRTGELRLSLDLPGSGEAARAEAALEIGAVAVSILVRTADTR